MAYQPPPFASKEYWENRFQQNEQAFDWLLPASCMDPQIIEALSLHLRNPANILHVGCGTSLLSFHLRGHVDDPRRIHNVDFSAKAIEWGLQNELVMFQPKQRDEIQKSDDAFCESPVTISDSMMRWSQVSLLSQSSILSSCPASSYAVIVDKSTADAIACGDDIVVAWPSDQGRERQDSCSPGQSKCRTEMSYFVHPLCLLALHLALVSVTGCRWIVLSYSSGRFPFLDDSCSLEEFVPLELLNKGYPNPSQYWRLIRREAMNAPQETNSGPTHRPPISHWLYVLERTINNLQPW